MTEYLSRGIYTTSQAGRLIGEHTRTVRRWAFGYPGKETKYPGMIEAEYPKLDGRYAVSFLDLVELLFIKGFRETGVSWQKLRNAAKVARRLFETDHPFAMRKWFADPAGIFVVLEQEEGEDVFVELSGDGQVAMRHTLDRYLHQLEFDIDDIAKRWFPAGKDVPVVVDPRVAFGTPVVEGTRIPTETLWADFTGPESVSDIAWTYDIEEWMAEEAVRFERSLRAA